MAIKRIDAGYGRIIRSGDDSVETALKETREEIGISLNPGNGKLFKSYNKPHDKDEGNAFYDIWLFNQDIDIADIVLQEDEICDAKWASKQEIRSIIENGEFIHASECPYIDELFAFCKSWRSSNIINAPILTTTLLIL